MKNSSITIGVMLLAGFFGIAAATQKPAAQKQPSAPVQVKQLTPETLYTWENTATQASKLQGDGSFMMVRLSDFALQPLEILIIGTNSYRSQFSSFCDGKDEGKSRHIDINVSGFDVTGIEKCSLLNEKYFVSEIIINGFNGMMAQGKFEDLSKVVFSLEHNPETYTVSAKGFNAAKTKFEKEFK